MDSTFHVMDIENWERRQEFEFFTNSGCGFTATAEVDLTHIHAYAKQNGLKLYPLLVAVSAKAVNGHREFKYGRQGENRELFGYYDVVHPLFFDPAPAGNVRCLCAEYNDDIGVMLENIARLRRRYADSTLYRPQPDFPLNNVNVSCLPQLSFTGLSFALQYAAYYYPPILTFGKYTEKDGRLVAPLSVCCNHAVNDGGHCAMVYSDFQRLADSL